MFFCTRELGIESLGLIIESSGLRIRSLGLKIDSPVLQNRELGAQNRELRAQNRESPGLMSLKSYKATKEASSHPDIISDKRFFFVTW